MSDETDQICALEQENARLQEIVDALVNRVESEQAKLGTDAYGYFQAAMSLEERVRQRTSALESALGRLESSNEELRQAKITADQANSAKSEFLATMSHEIRTPMHGVVGAIELLGRTRMDEEQQTLIQTLRGACDSMLRLIDDVLDIARLERQQIELEAECIQLREFLGGVASLFAPRAMAKGLSFSCEMAEDLPVSVRADAHRLRQILSNLLANAVKFTSTGSIAVEASTFAGEDGTQQVAFVVRDTGIGIDPELHAKVFEAFSQGDSSTTRRFGGTGLGLTIAARLADAMGGTISLEANKPCGTSFALRLPVQVVEARPELAMAPSVHMTPTVPTPSDRPSARFLVADDSDLNRDILRRMLTRTRAAIVDEVVDGAAALEACQSTSYDIVFMDWRMPRMDGIEATQRIRNLDDTSATSRDVSIIGLTANVQPADQARCIEAGMSTVLPKPFSMEQLLQVVADTMTTLAEAESSAA